MPPAPAECNNALMMGLHWKLCAKAKSLGYVKPYGAHLRLCQRNGSTASSSKVRFYTKSGLHLCEASQPSLIQEEAWHAQGPGSQASLNSFCARMRYNCTMLVFSR